MERIKRVPPLEEQVREAILKWIKANNPNPNSNPNQQLPSESELAKEFNVSRSTIRASLSSLASQGIIIRRQGSGTYMNDMMLTLRLRIGEQWEFLEMIRGSGFTPGIEFIKDEIIEPDPEVADSLCLEDKEMVLKIQKTFTANNKPAIYSINFLPVSLLNPPYDPMKIRGPIFPYLEEKYKITPEYSLTDIYAISSDHDLSQLLRILPNTPLLLFKDIFFNSKNRPIMYAYNYLTELLHFLAVRRPNVNWM